jgi:hypothetical protein
LSARVAALRKKYNLGARPVETAHPSEDRQQLSLGLEISVSSKETSFTANACAAQSPLRVLA